MRFDIMPVATEKQISEVETAAYNVWRNYYKDIFSPEQISYMLEKYQSKAALKKQMSEGYIYYMILVDQQLAGYMCVLVQSSYLYLARLYIKAEYRRQGLAKRTIAHLDAVFRNPELGFSHIRKMCLRVERNNHFAINVYEHLGFKKIRSEDTDIGNGFVCKEYVMERAIPAK